MNKIPEFYAIFAQKNARLHNKTTRSRLGRGQNLEPEAKILAFGLEDLTSLFSSSTIDMLSGVEPQHEVAFSSELQ